MITYSFANVQQNNNPDSSPTLHLSSQYSFEPLHDCTVTTACLSQDNLTNDLVFNATFIQQRKYNLR